MFKTLEGRERLKEVALDVLYVTAGVLIVVDWLEPELRIGRAGGCLLVVAVGITLARRIDRRLSRAWESGERSGRRHAEVEAASEPAQLAVVRDMARPQ